LIAANIANTWHLTSMNGGDVNGPANAAYSSFENLTGGVNNDSFIFSPAGGVSGTLNGGGGAGIDTLDYGLFTAPLIVILTPSATNTNSVAGFRNIIGGSGDDLLIGSTLANTITGNNGRDILMGGGGADNLDGGGGEDILIGGNTTWDGSLTDLTNIRARWI